MTAPLFSVRRLGHANLFVSDYMRAKDFYVNVVGFEEAYRQPDNRASFISNGNTYHDFGLTDVTSKYAPPNQAPGLNHFAFEMENEVELVAGYQRALSSGFKFRATLDHDCARALYSSDPDGNEVEIYADVVRDWRAIKTGIIIKEKPKWVPGVTIEPESESLYPDGFEYRRVPEAVFHAKRTTHVALVADDYEAMFDFYLHVPGLHVAAGGRQADITLFRGSIGMGDFTLIRRQNGMQPGLHHVGIETFGEAELRKSVQSAKEAGISIERIVDHPSRYAVTIKDPDGIQLQFYANRDWPLNSLSGVDAADLPYLL